MRRNCRSFQQALDWVVRGRNGQSIRQETSPAADIFTCISAGGRLYVFGSFLMLKYGIKKLPDVCLIVTS